MRNCSLVLGLFSCFAQAAVKNVSVAFIEPLEISDSTSSIRYKEQFEASIYYAIGQVESDLNKCGYSLLVEKAFFAASDPLAGARAAGDLLKNNIWLIFGPRRSEDILKISNVVNGAVPLIGPMAEATDFINAHQLNFSMYPDARELAKLSFNITQKKKFGKVYGVVNDITCPACVEFSKLFKTYADKQGYKKNFEVPVTKDSLDSLSKVTTPVDFVLVPNTSRISGQIVAELFKKGVSKSFVGSNGWGDEHFGYFSSTPLHKNIRGFAVRAGLSYSAMIKKQGGQSLSFRFNNEIIGPSYSSFNVMFFIRKLSQILCKSRPRDNFHFAKLLSKLPKNAFKYDIGLRSVEIQDGKLVAGEDFKSK